MDRYKIAGAVSYNTKISMRAADKAVRAIFGEITKALTEGETVVFRKFGSFRTNHKNARMGRNPKNGDPAMIEARTVVKFKSSHWFRNAVDNGHKAMASD